MNNLNTTIDKVAMSEFDMHYHQLGDNEKQWCHDEMVNNPEWLKKRLGRSNVDCRRKMGSWFTNI